MTVTLPLYAAGTKEPQIRFDIVTQADVKATTIELNFALQKQGNTLDSAAKSLQKLVQKLQKATLDEQIPSTDVQIQSTWVVPNDWLFGKDYIVASTAKITVRDMLKWGGIAKHLTQLDPDMQFVGVSYTYPKTSEVWDDLLTKGVKEMQDRKVQYEKLLGVKLTLTFLHEIRIRPYEQPVIRTFQKTMATSAQDTVPDMATLLPSQTYTLNLDIGLDSL